jgi:hypothetical protein
MQNTANLMKRAPGFRIAYWGVQIEHNDIMDLLVGKSLYLSLIVKLGIEWDSIEHHKALILKSRLRQLSSP